MEKYKEIERKFIVDNDLLNEELKNYFIEDIYTIKQGYLIEDDDSVLRIRTTYDRAFLTFKKGKDPLNRIEFEKEITKEDGDFLLLLCPKVLFKIRTVITHNKTKIEIDFFLNNLILAEIELKDKDDHYDLPSFIKLENEVTNNPAYNNSELIKNIK